MTTKVKVFFNFFIRFAILGTSLFFLYFQFQHKVHSGLLKEAAETIHLGMNVYIFLIFTVLLMFVNWGLEVLKWNILTRSFSQTSVSACVKGVISGITISMFLPNRIGDVAGKVLWLKQEYRWKGFFANIYTSLAQIAATCMLSVVALTYFIYRLDDIWLFSVKNSMLLAIMVFLIFLILLVYFNLGRIGMYFSRMKALRFRQFSQHISVLNIFSMKKKISILLLSILRFMVYCTQFYILLSVFGLTLSIADGIFLIAVIYLAITIVPQFAIAEIATRGALAIVVFEVFIQWGGNYNGHYEAALLLASTTLWVINLFIPAMAGLTMLPDLSRLKQMKK